MGKCIEGRAGHEQNESTVVHEQSYEGYKVQILQGTGGRYRYFIPDHTMSEMKFQNEDSCLQAAFRWIGQALDLNHEEERREKARKILNELKNDPLTLRTRIQHLEKIIGLLPDSEEKESTSNSHPKYFVQRDQHGRRSRAAAAWPIKSPAPCKRKYPAFRVNA